MQQTLSQTSQIIKTKPFFAATKGAITPPSAALRLTGTSFSYAGTVEIFHEGRWGAICSNNWNIVDARIFCRQLGYKDVVMITRNSYHGNGSQPSWMNNVRCLGVEKRIEDCPFDGWYERRCSERESAGAICGRFEIEATNNTFRI